MAVSELTITELRLKHAQLAHQAETARARWRAMAAGPAATAAMRRVKDLDRRVADYNLIIGVITRG
jgi:hypothetical protein